ncbi:hypothetical protein H632_c973p1 [Helicosporidium sp. ATCC 50920]|nr:hypothetical protein H632_c973p1 [Helicosporidium sp. ATCC 50920]|eukprot:KDD74943.1 hypothetical protein H632_c973p1 [Helicosporidium sp. ATCC 50920]
MSAHSKAAPIISLYRRIMRLHSSRLPPPMRAMGDAYARDEFRRHLRGSPSSAQWEAFTQEWTRYCSLLDGDPVPGVSQVASAAEPLALDAAALESMLQASGTLTPEARTHMSPEQLAKLEQLELEALSFGKSLFEK